MTPFCRGRHVGMVFQLYARLPSLTAEENIQCGVCEICRAGYPLLHP